MTATAPAAAATSTTPAPPPVLGVDDLSVVLGGRRVLENVTLRVSEGELVGLVGPNGAGKTTLLRAVLGLVPSSGRIRVTGGPPRNARTRPGRVRRHDGVRDIGYVPQRHEFAWDFPVTVQEAVLTGRVARIGWLRGAGPEDYRQVRRALDRVEMTHLRDRSVGELSGGQRQRVLVARALALDPRILLLDEPFTGLDVPTQEHLTSLFRELASEERAVVMTNHDLVGAVHASDRLLLLNRTVVAAGTPAQLGGPEPWMRAFGISAGSPLLAAIGRVAERRSDDGPVVGGPPTDGPVVGGPTSGGPVTDGPMVDRPVTDGPGGPTTVRPTAAGSAIDDENGGEHA